MADPANTPAVDSTSCRKRVLHVQPRIEAKRLCTDPNKDHNSSTSKQGASKSKQEILLTNTELSTTSNPSVESQDTPSTSTHFLEEPSLQNYKLPSVPSNIGEPQSNTIRKEKLSIKLDENIKKLKHCKSLLTSVETDKVKIAVNTDTNKHSSSRTSVDGLESEQCIRHSAKINSVKSKIKTSNLQTQNSSETKQSRNSKPSTSNSKLNLSNTKLKSLPKFLKLKDQATKLTLDASPFLKDESVANKSSRKRSSDTSKSKTNTNHTSNSSHKSARISNSVSSSSSDNSEASSSKLNSTYPTISHKYPLRSQGRLSASQTTALQLIRKATEKRRNREVRELGASSSQQVTREGNESSRLTRSGAVLRRSTRNKGHSQTTGSCASSSGASGSGSSSRRAARQHKVGAAAPAPLTSSSPNTTTTMAADQPDIPNNAVSGSEELPSPQEATPALAASGPSGTGVDSESDDSEVGRLQALLESRGLPPHLFGALGPRMQHLLHRSMGATNSSVNKAQQLLQGLQATGDEGQQLQAVIEMCQLLVMGNEDTLTGFPIKQVVPALINLLQVEHNFDMMNHACRALTYMMEALPRSSAVVVDAVPAFLEKLKAIQCMDVAEQSLTALDMLSRRHSKSILQAKGVQACLMYLDFFSINAQRNALSITANCCLNLTSEEFQFVSESLPLLANRLTQQDKKSVESVCLAFSRLVDSFQGEPSRLQEVAGTDLLTNLQQLLVVTPPVISITTFISVLRMLSIMCASCPDLALTLLQQNIAETLLYLLTGSAESNQEEVELISRQPQELYEITALIGELMPKLPSDGIFAVDALLERPTVTCKEQPAWQWRDDRGTWHNYNSVDSRTIETAHISGDDEVSLNTLGRTYTIDFHSMQQINEDTGTSRPVQRQYSPSNSQSDSAQSGKQSTTTNCDARVACLQKEHGLAASFIKSLFSVLYEVYSSSAGPAVRCKCLKALLRMVYYATSDLLKEVLKNQVVSSHIAGMMASTDLRIVVGALQMADILMNKLPEVFGVHFRREGVMHQITQLADPEVPLGVSPPKSTNFSTASFSSMSLNEAQPGPSQPSSSNVSTANGSATITPAGTPSSSLVFTSTPERVRARSPSPSHVRLSDVLKRKRAPKRSSGSGRSKSRLDDLPLSPSLVQDLFTKATSLGNSTSSNSSRPRYSGTSSKTSSFLSNLNPVRWGRSMNVSAHERAYAKDALNSCLGKSASNSNLTAGNREKTRTWIREQAAKFIEAHSGNELSGPPHPALNVISRLTSSIQKLPTTDCGVALQELREILIETDISPFEVNHSGLIKALLNYFADQNGPFDCDQRLRIFLNVFAALPLEKNVAEINQLNSGWMSALVTKLSGCVSQLEQFPVKVHDFPSNSGTGRGGTSALKFFNTHQLKCNLQRHPDCTNLKQWKGGTVKIDPLALVQAIERYLVVRGYSKVKEKDTADSDDADTDDDIDDALAAVVMSQIGAKHKLQFYIGHNVLPYNMTVYQAVRKYSCSNDQSETDTDNETPFGNSGLWSQTHTIYYKPIFEDAVLLPRSTSNNASIHSSRKGKGSSNKSTSRRKGDDLWNDGTIPLVQSPIAPFLKSKLPEMVDIQDASLEVLCLLRILNALNLYWNYLYPALEHRQILPLSDFLNSKIAAKASRQLQDPLVIMTGNLPSWLQQIASVCPFLFPFETRQLLFYVTSFDRDRALQRLLDMTPELTSVDSQERVTPRLDRRKRTISRNDILKQAEQVIQDVGSSKALLEVQYEDEVGTGLGPTLEFYALVSKELQRTDLDLWHAPDSKDSEYVFHATGLFPAPVPRSIKVGQIGKIKSKFRFLGKFMAKAVMDSRMLDIPFSVTFYRWLLGQEHCFTLADLIHVSPTMYKTLKQMQELVRERDAILENEELPPAEKDSQIEELLFDGCQIDDLSIDFVLPGYNIELMKNGKTTHVTIHNLHQYVNLVAHWFLVEGVNRQMESLREGFESVFPIQNLRMFHPEELEAVFCGNPRDTISGWDVKTLMECCKPDHGYTADSRAIKFLFEVLSSYNVDEQRLFIQFLTGSPRLPVGGFKALSPPLTVVRTTLEPSQNADNFLPSVMTCVNYLKLPDYSSIEVLKEKLQIAASEGQHSFHLS